MKLGDNALNNERLSLVITKLPIKNNLIFNPVLQYINNLETQEYPKTTLDLENLNFFKKLSSVLKIIR